MEANVAMIVFTVVGWGGGLAFWRWADAAARGFKAGADALYPERLTQKVYTARNVRVGAAGWMVFGTLSLGILIWRLFNGFGF